MMLFQHFQHSLNCLRNRVVLGEAVALKKGFKDGPCDHVLRQHLHGFIAGNAIIQIPVQIGEELGEGFPFLRILRGIQDGVQSRDMGLGYPGYVLRPFIPIKAVAAFGDQLGNDGPFEYRQFQIQAAFLVPRLAGFCR